MLEAISRHLPPDSESAAAEAGPLNAIHVSAAFTTLSACCCGGGGALPAAAAAEVAPLLRHAARLARGRLLGGRELASVLHASAKLRIDAGLALGCEAEGEAWWAELWDASEETMETANIQGALLA